MFRVFYIIFVTFFLMANGQPVFASWEDGEGYHPDLGCDVANNRFMILFSFNYGDDSYPAVPRYGTIKVLSQKWDGLKKYKKNECTLSNGKKISVTGEIAQGFSYSPGGTDPDRFFTLKINDVPVYYRKPYYEGYTYQVYRISSVVFEKGKLQECILEKPTEQEYHGDEVVPLIKCHAVSERLSGNHLTAEEKEALKEDAIRKELSDNLSPFCKAYDNLGAQDRITNAAEGFYESVGEFPVGHLSKTQMDINNDGKPDRIYRIAGGTRDCYSCGNRLFDGSYLIVFSKGTAKEKEFLRFIKTKEWKIADASPTIEELPQWDAYKINLSFAGSSGDSVYNVPITDGQKNYIYSFESYQHIIPSRSINELTGENKVNTVCKFP